jgi:hypothetical protein
MYLVDETHMVTDSSKRSIYTMTNKNAYEITVKICSDNNTIKYHNKHLSGLPVIIH